MNTINIGFGSNPNFINIAGKRSDLVAESLEVIADIKKAEPELTKHIKEYILDKTTIPNLAYSCIVLIKPMDLDGIKDAAIMPYVVLLEGTGELPETAKNIVDTARNVISKGIYHSANNQQPIWTVDDAIDDVILRIIREKIANVNYAGKKLLDLKGFIVPSIFDKKYTLKDILTYSFSHAINSLLLFTGIGNGVVNDLNITNILRTNTGTKLKFEPIMSGEKVINKIGQPIRADWKIQLAESGYSYGVALSPNSQMGITPVTTVCGYVDSVITQVSYNEILQNRNANLDPNRTYLRLKPYIVVTHMDCKTQSLGYALLSIVCAAVMVNKNMSFQSLMPKNINGYDYDVGSINRFIDAFNLGDQIADIKLGSPELTAIDKINAIDTMYRSNPSLAIDVDSFGINTDLLQKFAIGASEIGVLDPNSIKGADALEATQKMAIMKHNARLDIIEACKVLTNGAFPTDFNPEMIFFGDGFSVPTGIWENSISGYNDVRDIDLAFLATNLPNSPQYDELIERYNMSHTSVNQQSDTFLTKAECIAEVVPTARVYKTTRIVFTDEFITTLIESVRNAGLNITYSDDFVINSTTNQFLDQFKGASIDSNVIGRYMVHTTSNQMNGFSNTQYRTAYSNAGLGSNVWGQYRR